MEEGNQEKTRCKVRIGKVDARSKTDQRKGRIRTGKVKEKDGVWTVFA